MNQGTIAGLVMRLEDGEEVTMPQDAYTQEMVGQGLEADGYRLIIFRGTWRAEQVSSQDLAAEDLARATDFLASRLRGLEAEITRANHFGNHFEAGRLALSALMAAEECKAEIDAAMAKHGLSSLA